MFFLLAKFKKVNKLNNYQKIIYEKIKKTGNFFGTLPIIYTEDLISEKI